MPDLDPLELGKQLKKPSGDTGISVAHKMNDSNATLYDFVFSLADLKPDDTVLEIGFGNGKFIPKYFEGRPGIRVHGVDHSETMCKEAAGFNARHVESGQLTIKCEDAQKMSYPDGYFDKVFSLNNLYFWEPAGTLTAEIRRVLKKGGRLYLSYTPGSILKKLDCTQEVFNLYEKEDVAQLLRSHGFRVIDQVCQPVSKISIEGKQIDTINICAVAE